MTEWSRASTDDGQTFVFRDEGAGPLVVLVHGFPDTPHGWDRIAGALVEAGYRAVRPWLRGYHPETIVEGRPYDTLAIGDDPIRLLDALDVERAVLVGHDWGALICYSAAVQHPDRLSAIAPVSLPYPHLIPRDPKTAWAGRHFFVHNLPFAERIVRRDDFAYLTKLYERWAPDWRGPERDACIARAKKALRDDRVLSAALGYYRDASAKGAAAVAHRSPVPGLVVTDLKDMPVEVFEQSAELLGEGSEVAVLDALGHWPHREREDEFIAALLGFVGSTAV